MYSRRVDEVWHQFVLFTREYVAFSTRYFKRYIHHSPGNAPGGTEANATQATFDGLATFDGFKQRYEEVFGEKLPSVWYDERSITIRRRIVNQNVGRLTVRERPYRTDLLDGSGNVLLSVNDVARQALVFLSRTGAFYVRELPGGLIDEDKIALIATLVKCNVLRVGS
jgi:hypothetical protein